MQSNIFICTDTQLHVTVFMRKIIMLFNAVKNCIKGLWVKDTHSQRNMHTAYNIKTYGSVYLVRNYPYENMGFNNKGSCETKQVGACISLVLF